MCTRDGMQLVLVIRFHLRVWTQCIAKKAVLWYAFMADGENTQNKTWYRGIPQYRSTMWT